MADDDDEAVHDAPQLQRIQPAIFKSSVQKQVFVMSTEHGNHVVFLHIGKNAGTQITYLCQQLGRYGIQVHKAPHDTKLKAVISNNRAMPYFFSIRDPLSRFKSAFYSRKRKGQPRLYVEWSSYEAYAFRTFSDANDLAESLFRNDELGRAATRAISSLRHTAMHQIDWFEGALNFELRPPVWIIRQEKFNEDFNVFLSRLGVSARIDDLNVAVDDKTAHKNEYSGTPELSDLGKRNLRAWYSRDFAFYDLCTDWIHRNS